MRGADLAAPADDSRQRLEQLSAVARQLLDRARAAGADQCEVSCNEDAGLVLQKLHDRGVSNAILGHLSEENNTPELALVTVQSVLEEAGLLDSMFITVADRFRPCGLFEL